MAKKQFTDITIKMAQKECHFKRVTNETLTKFSEKAEKEYNDTVKTFVDEVELFDSKRESLEKKIALKTKQVEIIENKSDATDDELDKIFGILEEVEMMEEELETVKVKLLELSQNNPSKEYMTKVDELLAEKVETLLDGITAKEFLTNSDPVDTIKARNLEKYYQLAIVGEREAKIVNEMKEDVDNFLQSQKEL
jgi:hypothetical protein